LARKKKPPEHANHERWLVSYADFITLLFAFFTTLYAISTVDAKKMGKMVMSMRASFDNAMFESGSPKLTLGMGEGGGPVATEIISQARVPKDITIRETALQNLSDLKANFGAGIHGKYKDQTGLGGGGGPKKTLGELKQQIETLLKPEISKGKVATRLDARGLIISLGEIGLFDSGSDELKPEGRGLLDVLVTSLLGTDNQLRFEGHTDNVPIKTVRFPSNWELSTARATSVVSYAVTKLGLSPNRLSAAGYAEFHPVAANDSADGRARNRRIDVLVMDPKYALAEPH
jgi:chemotaxis protein MotB